ncbi:PDZ domain-containing protein MAGIX isoform X3 [Grus americana]|uniref:PDZ domain-containing protein MAGIX isoform X3 n=1 Tax=Grus americana TaxID=9117 RepID=UPI0024079029|nr:PDZ domain-containing protein MAGIX isoform X3 [Grus americana]
MPPPEAPPAPGVSVVVVVGGSCVLRYSRPPGPPPPPPWAAPPAWGGGGNWGDPGGRRGPPQIRRHDGDLVLLLRSLGAGTPPEPVAVTSFVGPEPRDLLPAVPPVDVDVEVGSTGGGPGYDLAWPQVSDQLLAINGAPTAGMTHAQALARIRGGGQPPAPAAAPGPRGPPKSVGEGRPHPLRQQLPPGRTLLLPRGTPGPPLTGRRWQSKVPPQFGEGGGGHPPSYAMPPPLPCVPPHFFWGGGCPTEAVAPPFFWGGAQ